MYPKTEVDPFLTENEIRGIVSCQSDVQGASGCLVKVEDVVDSFVNYVLKSFD